jgi:hypothetical protein
MYKLFLNEHVLDSLLLTFALQNNRALFNIYLLPNYQSANPGYINEPNFSRIYTCSCELGGNAFWACELGGTGCSNGSWQPVPHRAVRGRCGAVSIYVFFSASDFLVFAVRESWLPVCRSTGEPAVRTARAGRAAGVELQLHRGRRRHGGVPAGGDAVGALARAAPGARRAPLPQHVEPGALHGRAGGHVAGVSRAAVRLGGRRVERARPGAGRRELPERRVLHALQQRLRARRRVGRAPGQLVLPLGGARAGVPPRRAPVAGRAPRRAARGRRHPGQRLHVRPRHGHQDRRHHLRQQRRAAHCRRLPPPRAPGGAHRAALRHRLQDPLQTARLVVHVVFARALLCCTRSITVY